MNNPLIRYALALLAVMALLHVGAIIFYIYWSVWWFDIFMHFLGGIAAGLLALWLYSQGNRRGNEFWAALLGALIIGIAWEVYEYAAGVTYALDAYTFDTATDLVMDLVGALVPVWYVRRGLIKEQYSNV
jgi:hypothetical protein